MSVEWDPHKARKNFEKHGVTFSDAVTALEDEYALTIEDDNPQERRFITLGRDALGRLLVVVYMFRGDAVRIISVRKATALESEEYEAGK